MCLAANYNVEFTRSLRGAKCSGHSVEGISVGCAIAFVETDANKLSRNAKHFTASTPFIYCIRNCNKSPFRGVFSLLPGALWLCSSSGAPWAVAGREQRLPGGCIASESAAPFPPTPPTWGAAGGLLPTPPGTGSLCPAWKVSLYLC